MWTTKVRQRPPESRSPHCTRRGRNSNPPTSGSPDHGEGCAHTGYTWPKQDALSQWEKASDLARRAILAWPSIQMAPISSNHLGFMLIASIRCAYHV